ncbi:MAG: antitoxin component YwqK of YwqJK toxin-antitoxin module [Myxococcota bacterium]
MIRYHHQGVKTGMWTEFWDGGGKGVSEWADGKKNGTETRYKNDGKVDRTIGWKAGKMHGPMILNNNDGTQTTFEYVDGKRKE